MNDTPIISTGTIRLGGDLPPGWVPVLEVELVQETWNELLMDLRKDPAVAGFLASLIE